MLSLWDCFIGVIFQGKPQCFFYIEPPGEVVNISSYISSYSYIDLKMGKETSPY